MEDAIDYALRYGGRCRDCADTKIDGVCDIKGTPCDPRVFRAAIEHTLKAWKYGIEHGFMDSPLGFSDGKKFPAGLRELVVAARIVAFEDQSPEALKRLDDASEVFAAAMPWDGEPEEAKDDARATLQGGQGNG